MIDPAPRPSRRTLSALVEFFRLEAAGGIVLVVAAMLALLLANSPWADAYAALLALPVELRAGELQIAKPLLLWINDGLMAVFFLLVALELKREALQGRLASRAQLLLPLICAAGGVVLPAVIYAWLNRADAIALRGWAIPTATDIAFALGVLALLGARVPLALKVLLSAIAVIDDLVAIIVIALFYSADLSLAALAGAVTVLVLLVALNLIGVRRTSVYLLLGTIMWVCVLKSGVHATLAGVATGLLIPLAGRDPHQPSPLATLEHSLHPWVAFGILPLFAFANAGLALGHYGVSDLLHPVPLGVALGLIAGKTVGVFGAAIAAIGIGVARAPDGVDRRTLLGMAMLCGIGFTMSLFIGSLAFGESHAGYAQSHRLGILIGSILSALLGLAMLHFSLPRRRDAER